MLCAKLRKSWNKVENWSRKSVTETYCNRISISLPTILIHVWENGKEMRRRGKRTLKPENKRKFLVEKPYVYIRYIDSMIKWYERLKKRNLQNVSFHSHRLLQSSLYCIGAHRIFHHLPLVYTYICEFVCTCVWQRVRDFILSL